MTESKLGFYEFFAGGGLARLGLGDRWTPLFANDVCEKKSRAYRTNFPPGSEFVEADVRDLTTKHLPGNPLLAWASFPCQDLSLAGDRKGLRGERSGTFWPFWGLMEEMEREGRAIPMIVLENVVGAVTSNRGKDFSTILSTLAMRGYSVGPMVIDASHFVPQSRKRLFIVAVRDFCRDRHPLLSPEPNDLWHPPVLRKAFQALPRTLADKWIWWRFPSPPSQTTRLSDLIETDPTGVAWKSKEETERLLAMMSPANLEKVRSVQSSGQRKVGAVYRRTRKDEQGNRVQRAEVRFDELSGCLRTPAGGSSRQLLLFVEGDAIRSRLLSAREAARLMGAPDSYRLPANYNEAYHLMGDALAVPAVSWLERSLLHPITSEIAQTRKANQAA